MRAAGTDERVRPAATATPPLSRFEQATSRSGSTIQQSAANHAWSDPHEGSGTQLPNLIVRRTKVINADSTQGSRDGAPPKIQLTLDEQQAIECFETLLDIERDFTRVGFDPPLHRPRWDLARELCDAGMGDEAVGALTAVLNATRCMVARSSIVDGPSERDRMERGHEDDCRNILEGRAERRVTWDALRLQFIALREMLDLTTTPDARRILLQEMQEIGEAGIALGQTVRCDCLGGQFVWGDQGVQQEFADDCAGRHPGY